MPDVIEPKFHMKELRRHIHGFIREIEAYPTGIDGKGGRELALAKTKLQEARMWLGQVLGEIGNELPEEYQDK